MDHFERLKVLGRGTYGVATLVRCTRAEGASAKPACSTDNNDCAALCENSLCVAKEVDLRSLPTHAACETKNEVDVLKSLSHLNIVAYYATFVEDDTFCILMEYADAGDLSAAICRRREGGRRFGQDEAVAMLAQCGRALRHIHAKHVLHRDLKSQNIFLTRNGVIKLGDFGIARVIESTTNQVKTMIGTPTNLAPEVCDNRPYGTKADIWSLGIVFYEILALELPFKATNLAALAVKIISGEPKTLPTDHGEEVCSLVRSMLQKAPDQRPSASRLLAVPLVREASDRLLLPDSVEDCVAAEGGDGGSIAAEVPAVHSDRDGDANAFAADHGQAQSQPLEETFKSPLSLAQQALKKSPELHDVRPRMAVQRRSRSMSDISRHPASRDASVESNRSRGCRRLHDFGHNTGDHAALRRAANSILVLPPPLEDSVAGSAQPTPRLVRSAQPSPVRSATPSADVVGGALRRRRSAEAANRRPVRKHVQKEELPAAVRKPRPLHSREGSPDKEQLLAADIQRAPLRRQQSPCGPLPALQSMRRNQSCSSIQECQKHPRQTLVQQEVEVGSKCRDSFAPPSRSSSCARLRTLEVKLETRGTGVSLQTRRPSCAAGISSSSGKLAPLHSRNDSPPTKKDEFPCLLGARYSKLRRQTVSECALLPQHKDQSVTKPRVHAAHLQPIQVEHMVSQFLVRMGG